MNQPKRPAASGKATTARSQVPPRGGKGRPKPAGARPRPSAAKAPAGATNGAEGVSGGGAATATGGGHGPTWERRRRQRQRRKVATIALMAVVAAVVVVVVVVKVNGSGAGPSGPLGPEGVTLGAGPALAAAAAPANGAPTAGVSCGATEEIATHVHTHLAVYVQGKPRSIPRNVGIASGCLYYLHTHAADGIVHVEAPAGRKFVLGQFFAVWGQPLTDGQVGPATGPVTAFVNGHRWSGPLEDVPLRSHETIQLDVGAPVVAPQPLHFPGSL